MLDKSKTERKRVKWDRVIEIAEKKARQYLDSYGIAPTLRSLFYILVSEGILPNTQKYYQSLSRYLSEARYDRVFDWRLIRDETRQREHLEPYETAPRDISIDEIRERLERYIEIATEYNVNPWNDQPRRVIVALEKDAQYELVKRFIEEVFPFGVYAVIAMRGFDSATDLLDLSEKIELLNRADHEVTVLLITDWDPSGEYIAEDFVKRLRRINPELRVSARKIAVTYDQVKKFNLPAKPLETKEIKKLKRDPRYRWFIEKIENEGLADDYKRILEEVGVLRVELDALVALRATEFKQILKEEIEKEFDWKIYEEKTKAKLEEYQRKANEVRRKGKELLEKLSSLGEAISKLNAQANGGMNTIGY